MLPQSLLFKALGAVLLAASLFFSGWHLGARLKQGEWDQERANQATALSSALAASNAKVLAAEHAANQRIAAIGARYETQLQEQRNAENRMVHLNASGGLFINAHCPANRPSSGDPAARTASSDGATRVRLSESDGRFLIAYAASADQVANQLAACQAVIKGDREGGQ